MITPTMWANIMGHAFYQIIVLCVVLFYGEKLFGVECGRQNDEWTFENGQHYTIFFNIFVFLQVFNEINARKLKREEVNVFKGFFNNFLFVSVLIITIFVQVLIVEYGGRPVHVSPLSMHQHLVTIAIGMTSLIVGIFIKKLPEGWFENF